MAREKPEQEDLLRHGAIYWLKGGDPADGLYDHPACPDCWDNQGWFLRLRDPLEDERFRCPHCERAFPVPEEYDLSSGLLRIEPPLKLVT